MREIDLRWGHRRGGALAALGRLRLAGTAAPREAAFGGDTGRRANRDLDAVCALFEVAGRSEEVAGLRGVTAFLAEIEGQQIPADTLREAETRGNGVRCSPLTGPKAWNGISLSSRACKKGWPDLRRRGSLLEPDRLSRRGLSELVPSSARIAEERRLFYVACTRARRRLVVTAVAGRRVRLISRHASIRARRPDRYLAGRPRRPLSIAALIGELRSVSTDPETSPALREQATLRLARLADAEDASGRPLAGRRPLVGGGAWQSSATPPSGRPSAGSGVSVG